MRVRGGFVSNSSSTAFVIARGEYASVFDLARAMIRIREEDYDDLSDLYGLKAAERRGVDPDTGVRFPSCNFDTYVWRGKDGEFRVDTCNNVDWMGNKRLERAVEFYDGEHDRGGWHKDGVEFLFLRHGFVAKLRNRWEPDWIIRYKCEKHTYGDFAEFEDGRVACVQCENLARTRDDRLERAAVREKYKKKGKFTLSAGGESDVYYDFREMEHIDLLTAVDYVDRAVAPYSSFGCVAIGVKTMGWEFMYYGMFQCGWMNEDFFTGGYVLVDDVLTTGRSVKKAIDYIYKQTGVREPLAMFVLVNHSGSKYLSCGGGRRVWVEELLPEFKE